MTSYMHDIVHITYACNYKGGKNVKPEKNLIFLKNRKNNKIGIMVQGSLENYLDLR